MYFTISKFFICVALCIDFSSQHSCINIKGWKNIKQRELVVIRRKKKIVPYFLFFVAYEEILKDLKEGVH